MSNKDLFIPFIESIENYSIPDKFSYPFYYEPDLLAKLAVAELQEFLTHQQIITHNFGLNSNQDGIVIGKMFGVLVVKKQNGDLGYIAAYSGKLSNSDNSNVFVPTVFDMVSHEQFLDEGMIHLSVINEQLTKLESDSDYMELFAKYEQDSILSNEIIKTERAKKIVARKNRKTKRNDAISTLSENEYQKLEESLKLESFQSKFYIRELIVYHEDKNKKTKERLDVYLDQVTALKTERKEYSIALQDKIFDQYKFLNANGDIRSLLDIFSNEYGMKPPAGSGECAAPKLFQYAFTHNLEPISMAEFWWGKSPSSEIRKHQHFYPACKGKCEPILGHMLKGLEIGDNPLLENLGKEKSITTLYEDDYMLVIDKPAELLSVPGRSIEDSVQNRLKKKYPLATGPLVVHRLDMSTSGIMLIAKTKEVHKFLQWQFIKRVIKKKYVALLDGELDSASGTIDLPLRLDIDDRPRQLVCYEFGKSARTHWELVEESNGISRVFFYPITGRTHQLRVHAAHPSGLDMAIVGDDMYGQRSSRLKLHAATIEFDHPISRERMKIESEVPF